MLNTAIDSYFEWCSIENKPPTKVGLALHLGFADRQSLRDYKIRESQGLACCIKRAEAKIEQYLAERVVLGKGSAPGMIFTLKAMHGWQETQVVEHKHDVNISLPQIQENIRGLLAQASPAQLEDLGVIDVVPDLLPESTPDRNDK